MKKFIALGLTAVMILGVTGCGSSGRQYRLKILNHLF